MRGGKGESACVKISRKDIYAERDDEKKAETAEYLKAVTGKDYIPSHDMLNAVMAAWPSVTV